MLFGEIVEPSTRALIEDDLEEYPEYVQPQLIWKKHCDIPPKIDALILIESPKIIKLFQAFTLNKENVVANLQNCSLEIYRLSDKYIVSFNPKELTTGEVIEALMEWIRKADHIYAVTSEPSSAYQSLSSSEKPETLIRKLSCDKSSIFNCKKLESPNLISGLGADVLSFCIHCGLKSTLFVVYMDNSPLDSINTNPVIELMKSLGLPLRATPQNLNSTPSNLYL